MDDSTTLTETLERWRAGDNGAGNSAVEQAYRELRKIAASLMRGERDGHTLSPTALLNETYLSKLRSAATTAQDRGHFYALAARAMRQVLIEHSRKKQTQKRTAPETLAGGDSYRPVQLDANVLDLDRALRELRRKDSKAATIVELRHFLGMTNDEVADVLSMDTYRVRQEWEFAKVWLRQRLNRS